MNILGSKEFKNDSSIIEDFKFLLKVMFPDMKVSIIEKNIDFTILLKDYEGDVLFGIDDFLEDEKYELKGIKYIGNGIISSDIFTVDQKNKINSGKYNIGLKVSYKNRGNDIELLMYFIIAKKKDRFTFDWVKTTVNDLVPNKEIKI